MGKLFVISGASGVGKGTVLGKMTAKRGDLLFSLSATTRAPRPEDIPGVTYDFVTREKFMEMVDEDAFAEYDIHLSACYGTPRAQMEEKQTRGHVLLDIEPKGAFQVRERYPEVTLIFIKPPSMEELERRLRTRPDTTLTEEKIRERLERATWEMAQSGKYDYVVVNDDADRCADEILKIISDKEHEE
ncbi:MAG: guanylate kinase [Oscillospiraceae bacterium]|nr:guanylate kinase [Oscillospiraceae bacterium]